MIARPVVLVVDDEPLIRLYAVDVLTDAGFDTLEAADAEEAMVLLADNAAITVLFTDINMPGPFNGLELARKVHELRPDVQLIITSGKERPDRSAIPEQGTFLAKPYQGSVVAALIKSAAQGR
ncbi:MAG: response regulator [Sphingomonas bacterium]|nr:response regulator [Sphingomonas bacterium]MDB5689036.1 response regulator [Sphingomonas bacterium]